MFSKFRILQNTPTQFLYVLQPLNCISSRTCSAEQSQVGLCPIFLVTIVPASTSLFAVTINHTGQHRTALDTYQTAVVVLVHVFDVLKYLARVWQHLNTSCLGFNCIEYVHAYFEVNSLWASTGVHFFGQLWIISSTSPFNSTRNSRRSEITNHFWPGTGLVSPSAVRLRGLQSIHPTANSPW